jgi:iron complex transport system ATP-binding protein
VDFATRETGGFLVNLEIRDLTIKYNQKTAISNISLTVEPGEVIALIGPNGAGKSTLINGITGLLPLSSGGVQFGEQNLTSLSNSQRARILGVVPQARQLGGAFTVEQTVMIGRTAYMGWLGRASEKDFEAVQWAMRETGIVGFAQRHNAELSGGEQQRVLLARALAGRTPVLLLDEPTNHLDLQHQINFLSLVRTLTRRENLAVLMAMHDLNQVSSYADRVALLVDGSLAALGKPSEVMTAENIREAYHTPVEIIYHPEYKTPLILPKRTP